MLIIKGLLKNVRIHAPERSSPPQAVPCHDCTSCHNHYRNHRCSLISCIRFPLGQTFSIGIPRTGKVQPRTAHLVRQHLCRLSASGHRSMAHDIVEHKRNLHTMRAAEYSVHHGRFPSKHIHIDRCTLLCRLQFGLLHCAGAENEVHIHQVLGLITGVGLLKSFQKSSVRSPYFF